MANVCGTGACTPVTCSQLGKNCGSLSDGCSATLNCGTCSGAQTCGAGGVANVCGTGACTPTTCAAVGAVCGSVPDGCGGALSCGTCSGAQTCGGGGVANQCGASCLLTCPSGYSCDAQGSCVNGTQSGIVLNVTDPLKVTVAGTVTLNGGVPATGYCSSSYSRATVKFTHASNNHYDTSVTIGNCVSTTDAYAWTAGLRPGTYSVTVSGGYYSSLPSWEVVVNPAFTVSAAQSNVVLDVTDPLKVTMAGTVTLNGGVPATGYCSSSYSRATVKFTHASNNHYDTSVTIGNCVSTTDAYAWTAGLRPGTYSVTVSGGYYSSLPSWEVVVNPAFTVSAAQSNVVLDVTDPLKVTMAGTVTLNGGIPATGYCSSSYSRATVKFTHASNNHYDTTVTIGNCVSTTDVYTWTTGLRPGTYSVTVSGGYYSALPGWEVMVNPAFTVSAGQSNVVLNVTDPVKVAVSGTVTLNGGIPATSYCSSSYSRATVKFTHETDRHYDATVTIGNCVSTTDTYAWTTMLRPGTYGITVSGGYYSGLPSWEVPVVDRLVVR